MNAVPSTPSNDAGPQAPGDAVEPPRRGWRVWWTVGLVLLLAGIAALVWALTAPARERAAIAGLVQGHVTGTLDGDARSRAALTDPSNRPSSSAQPVMYLLDRASAEASLGAPVTVSVPAGDVTLTKGYASARAVVAGSRSSLTLEVTLVKDDDGGQWTMRPAAFPTVSLAPTGPGTPSTFTLNGASHEYPAEATALILVTWPSDAAKLSLEGKGGASWGETDLGRIPASSFRLGGDDAVLSWAPKATYGDAPLKAAQKLGEEWFAKKVAERAKVTGLFPKRDAPAFVFTLPESASTDARTVRNVKGEVLTPPRATLGAPRASVAIGAPLSFTLSKGRAKFTGEWLDGSTWRSFTSYSTISEAGTLSDDLLTFTPNGALR